MRADRGVGLARRSKPLHQQGGDQNAVGLRDPHQLQRAPVRVHAERRSRELAGLGVIGSVADFHYSFMGATAPQQMETAARTLAGLLKKDKVTAALLVPV